MIGLANVTPDILHSVAHLFIFAGYMFATLLVTPTIRRILKISRVTMVAGSFFFLCCGVTHLGIMLGYETAHNDSIIFLANDTLQAFAIWVFLISMYTDVRDAIARLTLALLDLRVAFYTRARDVKQIIESGGDVDPAKVGEQSAQWATSRLLDAFMDIPSRDPPSVERIERT